MNNRIFINIGLKNMEKYEGIGILDSGVGGLTVASSISRILPGEKIVYYGDTAHLPYGDKTEGQILNYVGKIIDFLTGKGIKALILACNTSSALVLPRLNGSVKIPVLGVIEFASRMALEASRNERIGIVANPLTVKSCAYIRTIRKISKNGTQVYQSPCPQWVSMVEAGKISGKEVEEVVENDLSPLIAEKIDTLILGCTHYPYLSPTIRRVLKNGVKIIDPAEALALQMKKILDKRDIHSKTENPQHEFFVSGDPDEFQRKGSLFFGRELPDVERVEL